MTIYSLDVLLFLFGTSLLFHAHEKSWLMGKDSEAGRDWGQEEKGTTADEMAEWHHWLDRHEFEWTPGVGDGQGSLACCDSWGRKESDMTEWLNWTELNWKSPAWQQNTTLSATPDISSWPEFIINIIISYHIINIIKYDIHKILPILNHQNYLYDRSFIYPTRFFLGTQEMIWPIDMKSKTVISNQTIMIRTDDWQFIKHSHNSRKYQLLLIEIAKAQKEI